MNGLGMIASRMQALQERAEKAEAKVQEQAAALASVEREMAVSNLYDEAENRVVCVSDLRAALAGAQS